MQPLILTDRHGESYAIFPADAPIPLGYYPADLDRSFNWAMRFVMSLSSTERRKLEAYARPNPSMGIDPLIELLERRRLLVYRKDTSKQDKLAVEVLRNAIREVLDNILAEERKEAEAIAHEHEKRNRLEKTAAYHQAFNQGAAEGAFSLLKFLKELRDVVDPMRLFTRSGKSAWDAAEGGLEGFADKFTRNLSAAHYREIVEALGFDPARIDRKTLYLALDIAQTVWEDADTQAVLTRFARELAATQHGLEWAKLAGGAAFELMLTAILAALTAGTGVAVSLGTKAARLKKLGELLHDMVAPLKRFRRRWTYGGKGKPGAGARGGVVVDEVEVPTYNEPPGGERSGPDTEKGPGGECSVKDPSENPRSLGVGSREDWPFEVFDVVTSDANVVQQQDHLACGFACGQMLSKISGKEIPQLEIIDYWRKSDYPDTIDVESLGRFLNENTNDNWIGGAPSLPISDKELVKLLNDTGSWGATIKLPGSKVDHMVIVDGFDDSGKVLLRDPWDASRLSVRWEDFESVWNGNAVWRQ